MQIQTYFSLQEPTQRECWLWQTSPHGQLIHPNSELSINANINLSDGDTTCNSYRLLKPQGELLYEQYIMRQPESSNSTMTSTRKGVGGDHNP